MSSVGRCERGVIHRLLLHPFEEEQGDLYVSTWRAASAGGDGICYQTPHRIK